MSENKNPMENNESANNKDIDNAAPAETNKKMTGKEGNETGGVDFSSKASVSVVKSSAGDDKKKKIIIIACAVIALIAIAVVIFIAFGKNLKKGGEEETSDAQSGYIDELHKVAEEFGIPQDWLNQEIEDVTDAQGNKLSAEEAASVLLETLTSNIQNGEVTTSIPIISNKNPNVITEETTAKVTQGASASDSAQVDAAKQQIDIFLSRKFYLKGAMYSGGTGDALHIAMNGDDFEVSSNLDGIEVSMCHIGDKLYIKRPSTKKYVEMDNNLMGTLGLSMDDFSFDFASSTLSLYATYDVKVNNEDGICYIYEGETGFLKFYSVNGVLKQIERTDKEGNVEMQIKVDLISSTIPADQLTVKGYTADSFLAVFADQVKN